MDNTASTVFNDRIARGAAVALFIAGIVHFIIVPHHWGHAPAHGIFMGLIGVAEVAWAVAFWVKPSNRLAQLGLLLAAGCIALWGITRIFPAPFTHAPEEVDAGGIISKVLEFAVLAALIAVLPTLSTSKSTPRIWRTVVSVALLAVILSFGVYGAAWASEPFFPGLAPPAMHEQSTSMPSMDMPGMDMPTPAP